MIVSALLLVSVCVFLPGLSASDVRLGHPAYPPHSLIIRAYPGIENVQSDIYEVYQEPYNYNLPKGRSLDPDDSDDSQDLRAAAAVAVLQGEGEATVSGEILFIQKHPPAGAVLIKGNITGLPKGKHGIHIHQSGDLRKGCEKLGGHFNPFLLPHGSPHDPLRHAGDLGNVEAKEDGTAEVKLIDPTMSLTGGGRSVVGRAIVITEAEDDLGRGGTADSVTTGSSGKPLACGVIAYIK